MRKAVFIFFVIFVIFDGYSQNTFKKGYYIDNSGRRVECWIRNKEPRFVNLEYRILEKSAVKSISFENVKEFEIYNTEKYIKEDIENCIGNKDENSLAKKQVFLKVLVEGKASLYEYKSDEITCFFYKTEKSGVKLLVPENNISNNKDEINNDFRQQLKNDLKCSKIRSDDLLKIEYNKKSLIKFFVKYNNKCNNKEFKNYDKKINSFNLSFRPRLNSSSLSIYNVAYSTKNNDFGSKISFGFGIEAEYILSSGKNEWALIIEPSFQSFKDKNITYTDKISGGILISEVNYNSVEIPGGVRYYFRLNKKSKIFLNASFVVNLDLRSEIEFRRGDDSYLGYLKINSLKNSAFGIGYKLRDRVSLELRYQTSRTILGGYYFWFSDYKTVSVILGISVF